MPIKNYSATAGLTFQEIANEFGGVVPHSSNEYYAGGAYVTQGAVGYPSGGGAVAIPSSGTVSFNNYFGSQRSLVVDVLIIAGGGGGARGGGDNDVGNGGGGAGGYVSITGWGPIYAGTTWYAVIGAGASGGYYQGANTASNTTFAGYTAFGGGSGGSSDWGPGSTGGSGGGNAGRVWYRSDDGYGNLYGISSQGVGSYGAAWPSGSGLVEYYGYQGGLGTGWGTAGGGGGAGGAGGSPNGGNGRQWLDGNYYAGGGGGNTTGAGGSGIGGYGETWYSWCVPGPYGYMDDGYGNLVYQPLYYGVAGGNGVANTGSGGGAGSSGRCNGPGGNGGSGVVIVRYPGSTTRASGGTIYTSGGYVYHKFTSSGTWSF